MTKYLSLALLILGLVWFTGTAQAEQKKDTIPSSTMPTRSRRITKTSTRTVKPWRRTTASSTKLVRPSNPTGNKCKPT